MGPFDEPVDVQNKDGEQNGIAVYGILLVDIKCLKRSFDLPSRMGGEMNVRATLLAGVAAAFLAVPGFVQTIPQADPPSPTAGDPESAEPDTADESGTSDTAKPKDKKPDSDIIGTGTRIVRPNMASNAPITVVDESFLRERGLARVEDALSQIPQITPMLGLQGNDWASGRATINLRRLGAGRSLILLNGQRMENDVGIVPGALIERIDVMTGGASAVYGSDAIAGVVNFILKRRFNGVVLDAEASGIQHHNDNASMLRIGRQPVIHARRSISSAGEISTRRSRQGRTCSIKGSMSAASSPISKPSRSASPI